MSKFADPRAAGLVLGSGYAELLNDEGKALARATGYDGWWGVCSLRSRIPISRRALSGEEALNMLRTTVWLHGAECDEFFGCGNQETKAGILYIRSLLDEEVLNAARSDTSPDYQIIKHWMPEGTNPDWITARCAEEAYMRDIMDAQEMDWITR